MFSTPALSDSRFGELTEMFDEKKRIDKIYLDQRRKLKIGDSFIKFTQIYKSQMG